jgi:hypothetical protein
MPYCKNIASSHYTKPLVQYDEILKRVYREVFVRSCSWYSAVHLAAVRGLQASEERHHILPDIHSLKSTCITSGNAGTMHQILRIQSICRKHFTKIGSNFCMEIQVYLLLYTGWSKSLCAPDNYSKKTYKNILNSFITYHDNIVRIKDKRWC